MYPLVVFPYLRTLRAVFSETMCFYAQPRQAPAEFGLKGTWIRCFYAGLGGAVAGGAGSRAARHPPAARSFGEQQV